MNIRKICLLMLMMTLAFSTSCKKKRPIVLDLATLPENKRVVLFIGDSLTEGYGLEKSQTYPALIEEFWKKDLPGVQVRNAGISGDTTAGVLGRLDSLLTDDVGFVFLAIGSNDGLRGLPIAEIESNLERIIERIQDRQIPLALAGAKIPLNPIPGYVNQFNGLFARVAHRRNIAFMPLLIQGVYGKADLNLDDRVHPNAQGHRVMADNVLQFLNPAWKHD